MAFSIHFLEAYRASQVSDKIVLVHTSTLGKTYYRLSAEVPRRPNYEVRKYRHKVYRRLPLSHNHGNTVSVTNVTLVLYKAIDGLRPCRPSEASEQHHQQMTYCSTNMLTQPLLIEFQDPRSACDVIVSYLL